MGFEFWVGQLLMLRTMLFLKGYQPSKGWQSYREKIRLNPCNPWPKPVQKITPK